METFISLASFVWIVVFFMLCWNIYPTLRLIDHKMLPRMILVLSHFYSNKIWNYMNSFLWENNDKRNLVFTLEESFVEKKLSFLPSFSNCVKNT